MRLRLVLTLMVLAVASVAVAGEAVAKKKEKKKEYVTTVTATYFVDAQSDLAGVGGEVKSNKKCVKGRRIEFYTADVNSQPFGLQTFGNVPENGHYGFATSPQFSGAQFVVVVPESKLSPKKTCLAGSAVATVP